MAVVVIARHRRCSSGISYRLQRVVKIVVPGGVIGRGAIVWIYLLFWLVFSFKPPVAIICKSGVLECAAAFGTGILTYLGQLISRIVRVHGRGIDGATLPIQY